MPKKTPPGQLDREIAEALGSQPLTPAERRTLGNILASGGTGAVTQGRNWSGTIRKSVVAQLERRGLVESVLHGPSRRTYYATAAGVRAFGPHIAKIS